MNDRLTLADRFGAGCGAAYVLLVGVGNQLATGNSEDPHPSGVKDLADFSTAPTTAQAVGFTLEVVGLLSFIFFLGWLGHALRQRVGSAPWLGNAAVVAGIITLSVKLASVMPIVTGEVDHRQISPTLARVLMDMNGSAFVVTFLTYGVFLAACGAAFLASGFMGRVAGWSGVLIGALTVLVTVATRIDPVNTNVVPFLLALVWLLVVGVRLAWRGPRTATVAAVPAGATVAA